MLKWWQHKEWSKEDNSYSHQKALNSTEDSWSEFGLFYTVKLREMLRAELALRDRKWHLLTVEVVPGLDIGVLGGRIGHMQGCLEMDERIALLMNGN